MMDRNFQHRLSKIEKFVSAALKEREEKDVEAIKELPVHARHHATAVAAIALAGQPQINEPLICAWERALQHYGINVYGYGLGRLDNQVEAARRLYPIIMGGKQQSVRFAEIFEKAPVWLMQFTAIPWDAHLLEFHLPDISHRLRWGSAGSEEARRWPLLPSGMLTEGDPIPVTDSRQLWLAYFCIVTTYIPNFLDQLLLARKEEKNVSHRDDVHPLLAELNFALELNEKPEEEWSPYEKRRMRKISKRISRFESEHWLPRAGYVDVERG